MELERAEFYADAEATPAAPPMIGVIGRLRAVFGPGSSSGGRGGGSLVIKDEIERELGVLVGLPLAYASRVVDMGTFGFGAESVQVQSVSPSGSPTTACTSRRSGGSSATARSCSATRTTSTRRATPPSGARTSSPASLRGPVAMT